jgi:hypothetical protein
VYLKRVFADGNPWPYLRHKRVLGDQSTAGSNQRRDDFERSAANRDGDVIGQQRPSAQINGPSAASVNH